MVLQPASAQEHGTGRAISTGSQITVQVPRLNVAPLNLGNLGSRDYVYRYPDGYVRSTPLATLPQSQVLRAPAARPAPELDPGDNLNGVLTAARNPQARANALSLPAQRDVRYSNLQVANVQQELRRRGYYAGAVDGQLGPETEAGLQRFQVDQRQPVTGLIDRSVLSRLGLTTPAR